MTLYKKAVFFVLLQDIFLSINYNGVRYIILHDRKDLRGLLFFTFSVIIYFNALQGQVNSGSNNTTAKKDSVEPVYYLKSNYFTFKTFPDTIAYGDTLITDAFPYYNPVDTFKSPVADKGNIGSSIMPLTGYTSHCGFDIGVHGYDYLDKNKDYFQWHINKVPFSQVFASPSSKYENFWVGAKFSRNFKDINLNIDYYRINNQGKYLDQNTKHTGLNFGIWKGNTNSKFNTFINVTVNIHDEEENGGVDSINFNSLAIKTNVGVKLNDAVTRLEKSEIHFAEIIRLSDNFSLFGFKPFVKSEIGYIKGFYKFYDKNISSDSIFYGKMYADPTGLRNYIRYNSIPLSASLIGINKNQTRLETGIRYSLINYIQEPLANQKVNQIELFADGKIDLSKNLILLVSGAEYLGNFKSNYLLNSKIIFKNKYINGNGGIELKNSSPSMIQQSLYLTGKEIYQNNFENIKSNSVFASLSIDKIGLNSGINYSKINNYIYFANDKLPYQLNNSVDILHFWIEEKIKVWKIAFDNRVDLLKSSDEVIPVPDYTLRSKLYFNGMLFNKVLELRTGFEFTFWDKYFNYNFNPANGNYFVQNKIEMDNFQRLDYFVNARIGNFQIFVRVNNLLYSFPPFDIRYKLIEYPQYDTFFRFGVKWLLMN